MVSDVRLLAGALARCLLAAVAAVAIAAAPPARAAGVQARVELGWDGVYRPGRWTPVYVTASDPSAAPARNVVLKLSGPHDSSFAVTMVKAWTLSPTDATTVIYAPVGGRLDETVVTILDAATGRRLFEQALDPEGADPFGPAQVVSYTADVGDLMIGVGGTAGGRGNPLAAVTGKFDWYVYATDGDDRGRTRPPPSSSPASPASPPAGRPTRAGALAAGRGRDTVRVRTELRTGMLPARRLPDVPAGYDALDLLVLPAPTFGQRAGDIPLEAQQAIADWVRAGGRLLTWVGPEPIPASSPLAGLLPATVGEARTIPIPLETTRKHGLAPRVDSLASRPLTPAGPGTERLDLLDGRAALVTGRAGLGTVGLLSIDASGLVFEGGADADGPTRFWRPILMRLLAPDVEALAAGRHWGSAPSDQRRMTALNDVVDRLGDVEGVGAFDFSYVALVLVGLMVIVGPVDWFVLRKLNRQPWTWVTITGWIVLVTAGAVYLGSVMRSGDLHYRTVRLVDQADDRVVGLLDVVGIYSPRTQGYGLDGAPETWWRPAPIEAFYRWQRQGRRGLAEVLFEQDRLGARPLVTTDHHGRRRPAMQVNIWNLRFMQGETYPSPAAAGAAAAGAAAAPSQPPAVVSAKLRLAGASPARLVGTITNHGARPLEHVRLWAAGRWARPIAPGGVAIASIGPGLTVSVDAVLEPGPPLTADEDEARLMRRRMGVPAMPGDAPGPAGAPLLDETQAFILAAGDLAAERSGRIRSFLASRDDLVLLTAQAETPAPAVPLLHDSSTPALEKHLVVVRALLRLEPATP